MNEAVSGAEGSRRGLLHKIKWQKKTMPAPPLRNSFGKLLLKYILFSGFFGSLFANFTYLFFSFKIKRAQLS